MSEIQHLATPFSYSSAGVAGDYVLISPVDVLHAWAVIQKMLNYAPK